MKRTGTDRVPRAADNPVKESAALTVDGQEYRLVYDYGAIAEAEATVNHGKASSDRVNLLFGIIGSVNAVMLPGLFLAALHSHHPEITLEQVIAMIRPDTVLDIYNAIAEANDLSLPEKKRKDPTAAAGEVNAGG